jgi:hypothetical protein
VTAANGASANAEVNNNVVGSTLAKKAASVGTDDRKLRRASVRNDPKSKPPALNRSISSAARRRREALGLDGVTVPT